MSEKIMIWAEKRQMEKVRKCFPEFLLLGLPLETEKNEMKEKRVNNMLTCRQKV